MFSSRTVSDPKKASVQALLVTSLALGLFSCVAMHQTGVPNVGIVAALITSAGWFVVVTGGAIAQKALIGNVSDSEQTFAVAAGIVLSSMAVLGFAELFQITAAEGIVVLGVAVICLLFGFRSRFAWAPTRLGVDLLVVPICALFVLVWCWGSLTSVGEMPKSGTISLWTDIFIHATTVLQYGDYWNSGRSNIEFVNAARPLYHYGSYVLPAALLPVLDMSGLQAAVALHLPIGLLAMFAGTYTLAKYLAPPSFDQTTGVLSICLLFVMPDTSTYGLANGWFGVRWMLLSSPGSSYAIAGTLISLIFVKLWLDQRKIIGLVAAVVFAIITFQLRVHMLLWYFPTLFLFILFANKWWEGISRKYIGVCAVVLLAALVFANVGRYLWFVHVENNPTGYSNLYPSIVGLVGEKLAMPVGFVMLYPGMLGVLVLAYPILLVLAARVYKLEPLALFPMVMAGVAGLIIIWAPASANGDPFEFKHRPFILLYVVTLIWTCDLAIRAVFRKFSRKAAAAILTLPVMIFAVLALMWPTAFMSVDKPKFQWGKQYVDTSVSMDLIAAADYVRLHANRGDIALVAPIDIKARAADDATRFASIANVPVYVSRFSMWNQPLANSRLEVASTVVSQAALIDAQKLMRKHGLKWLVLSGGVSPLFDPGSSHATFKKNGWTVYRFD